MTLGDLGQSLIKLSVAINRPATCLKGRSVSSDFSACQSRHFDGFCHSLVPLSELSEPSSMVKT